MNKTERRHELQQNDLAAYLEQANKRVEPYSKQILVGILLLLAIFVAISFYSSELDADSSMATMNLIQNTNQPEQDAAALSEINANFAETSAGKLAKLYEGMALVAQGNQTIYTERENAEEKLNQGIEVLNAVATTTDDDLLKSRAHLGVALASTTLGNNEAAITAYKAVITANESEAMVKNAESRIESLSSQASLDFAKWFKNAEFKTVELPNLDPSLPPSSAIPGLDLNLPGLDTPAANDSADAETNPLQGEAAPRDLDGGLDLPTTPDKAPAAETDKAPAAETDKAPAAETDKAPAAETDKAPAAETDKAPAAETDKAPAAETDKAAEGSTADNAATNQ